MHILLLPFLMVMRDLLVFVFGWSSAHVNTRNHMYGMAGVIYLIEEPMQD